MNTPAASTTTSRTSNGPLVAVLAALAGVVFALLAIEVAFRIVSHFSRPALWTDRPHFYYVHDGAQSPRDLHYAAQKPANTYRIAVVGDSISFGPHMESDDTFAARLGRMLNLNSGSALRAEVIDYGIPGYSTDDEVPLVVKALEEQADLIVLQICLNDAELEPLRGGGMHAFGACEPSRGMRTLFRWWSSLGFVMERLHNMRSRQAYKDYFFRLYQDPRGMEKFSGAIKKIAALTKSRNVTVVPVLFPLFGFTLDDGYPFQSLHERVKQLYEEQGLSLLDLLPAYRNVPIDRLVVIPGGDLHPNEIAHRIAAETIYAWLADRKSIPEALTIKRMYRERENPRERSAQSAQVLRKYWFHQEQPQP